MVKRVHVPGMKHGYETVRCKRCNKKVQEWGLANHAKMCDKLPTGKELYDMLVEDESLSITALYTKHKSTRRTIVERIRLAGLNPNDFRDRRWKNPKTVGCTRNWKKANYNRCRRCTLIIPKGEILCKYCLEENSEFLVYTKINARLSG